MLDEFYTTVPELSGVATKYAWQQRLDATKTVVRRGAVTLHTVGADQMRVRVRLEISPAQDAHDIRRTLAGSRDADVLARIGHKRLS